MPVLGLILILILFSILYLILILILILNWGAPIKKPDPTVPDRAGIASATAPLLDRRLQLCLEPPRILTAPAVGVSEKI